MRMAPPGRTSSSQTGFVNPRGPHHSATRFGSVQALNTSSRGASNTRVSTNSCPSFGTKLPVAMLFLLFLHVLQIFVQTVKTFGPEPLVVRQPFSDILERRGANTAWPPLRLARACYQTSVFQNLEVAGNGGPTHCKGRRPVFDRCPAPPPAGAGRTGGGGGRGGDGGGGTMTARD